MITNRLASKVRRVLSPDGSTYRKTVYCKSITGMATAVGPRRGDEGLWLSGGSFCGEIKCFCLEKVQSGNRRIQEMASLG